MESGAQGDPFSAHHGLVARKVSTAGEPGDAGDGALGSAEMSRIGTLAEYEHDCHVAASLGLAVVDNSLLARDSVICKNRCGGMTQAARIVAQSQQVGRDV